MRHDIYQNGVRIETIEFVRIDAMTVKRRRTDQSGTTTERDATAAEKSAFAAWEVSNENDLIDNNARQIYSALLTWRDEHEGFDTNWSTMTALQKDAAARLLHKRVAKVFNRLAEQIKRS